MQCMMTDQTLVGVVSKIKSVDHVCVCVQFHPVIVWLTYQLMCTQRVDVVAEAGSELVIDGVVLMGGAAAPKGLVATTPSPLLMYMSSSFFCSTHTHTTHTQCHPAHHKTISTY